MVSFIYMIYNKQYTEDIDKESLQTSMPLLLSAVRQKRKKNRKIDDGACEIESSWDLWQNNNCDISICLSGNEVWSGDDGP